MPVTNATNGNDRPIENAPENIQKLANDLEKEKGQSISNQNLDKESEETPSNS